MNFTTINKAATMTKVPQSRLRAWLKEGRLLGFYSGSRYYVDVDRLEQRLESGYYNSPAPIGEAANRIY